MMKKKKLRSKEARPTPRHCDDYADDPTTPESLRAFLDRARAPAHGLLQPEPFPTLFADLEGTTYRVTMASRMGDVGITRDFAQDTGYQQRVWLEHLTNFRSIP